MTAEPRPALAVWNLKASTQIRPEKRRAFLLSLILLATPALFAAEPAPFTLQMAVERALAQSPAVRVDEQETERRSGVLEQAGGRFDWISRVSGVLGKKREPTLLGPVNAEESVSYSAAIGRSFRNGLSVQPIVETTVTNPRNPLAPSVGVSNLSLKIVVPLLRGLGAASAGADEAAARGDVDVARLLYRHSLSRQAFTTANAYWTASAADAAFAVRLDDEQRARHLHEGLSVLVETRVFTPDTLLQSEANLRQKSTSRQEAERVRFDALFSLARVVGLAPEEFAAPPAPTQPLPENPAPADTLGDESARIAWIRRAFAHRADFLALQRGEDPLRILTRAAELDLKPKLDLGVRGGYAGLSEGDDLAAPLSERLTGANGEVTLDLEWPMGNHYQRGLLRSRRAALRQAEFSTAQGRIDVASQVASALSEVRLRAETVRNASVTVGIARRAVVQEQRKLQTGESSVLDVINLENLLSSARLSEIDARAGYAVAAARLRFVLGEIFTPEEGDRSFRLHDLVSLPSP